MHTIHTKSLTIKPIQNDDANAPAFLLETDDPVTDQAFWKEGKQKNNEQNKFWFSLNGSYWGIQKKSDSIMLGAIALRRDWHRRIEQAYLIGFFAPRQTWDESIYVEAINGISHFAFEGKNALLISIAHTPDCVLSRRAITRCGFIYESTIPYAVETMDGKISDLSWYYKTRATGFVKHNDSEQVNNWKAEEV